VRGGRCCGERCCGGRRARHPCYRRRCTQGVYRAASVGRGRSDGRRWSQWRRQRRRWQWQQWRWQQRRRWRRRRRRRRGCVPGPHRAAGAGRRGRGGGFDDGGQGLGGHPRAGGHRGDGSTFHVPWHALELSEHGPAVVPEPMHAPLRQLPDLRLRAVISPGATTVAPAAHHADAGVVGGGSTGHGAAEVAGEARAVRLMRRLPIINLGLGVARPPTAQHPRKFTHPARPIKLLKPPHAGMSLCTRE